MHNKGHHVEHGAGPVVQARLAGAALLLFAVGDGQSAEVHVGS